MARARSITSGLRSRGINGPNTGVLRAAKNSAAAFFWSSFIFAAGISGMRSAGIAPNEPAGLLDCIASAPVATTAQALARAVLIAFLLDRVIAVPPAGSIRHDTLA